MEHISATGLIKIFLGHNTRIVLTFVLIGLCLSDFGCSTGGYGLAFPSRRSSRQAGIDDPTNPRTRAALQMTDQGRTLLEEGKPDDAISMFERSLGLDPAIGQTYYYLSEAWLIKGNVAQAEEFNHLADLYSKDDRGWTVRINEQRKRIAASKRQQGE